MGTPWPAPRSLQRRSPGPSHGHCACVCIPAPPRTAGTSNNWRVPAGSPGTTCWPGTRRTPGGGRRPASWGISGQSDLLYAGPAVHAVAERTRQRVAAGLPLRNRPVHLQGHGQRPCRVLRPGPSGPRASAVQGHVLHTARLHHPLPRAHRGREYVPKMGWTRLGPILRYADGKPLTVRVKQESGLNRSILASGWGPLERKLDYKAGQVVYVNPAYTSQACSLCGHTAKSNRRVRSLRVPGARRPQRGDQHPGAGGTGAAARRGALPPWSAARPTTGTPATREPDMRGVHHRI